MKVWLDDVRPAPEGWNHVLTLQEVIDLLRSGEVEEISLDHDLGLFTPEGAERTGYHVLVWIEEQAATGLMTFPLPEISIHSANAVGRLRMAQAIESIKRFAGDLGQPCATGKLRGLGRPAPCSGEFLPVGASHVYERSVG